MDSMIRATGTELFQAEAALQSICHLKLEKKAAYHVAKLTRLVEQANHALQLRRNAYIKAHGVERDGQPGSSFEIAPDSAAWQPFQDWMREQVEAPIEIAWSPLTLEQLGEHAVSPADLNALGPFLAEPPTS